MKLKMKKLEYIILAILLIGISQKSIGQVRISPYYKTVQAFDTSYLLLTNLLGTSDTIRLTGNGIPRSTSFYLKGGANANNNPDSLLGYRGTDYLRTVVAASTYYPLSGNPSGFLTSLPDVTTASTAAHPTNVNVDTKGRVISMTNGLDSNFFTMDGAATGNRNHDFRTRSVNMNTLASFAVKTDSLVIAPGADINVRVNVVPTSSTSVLDGVLLKYGDRYTNAFDDDALSPVTPYIYMPITIDGVYHSLIIQSKKLIQTNLLDTIFIATRATTGTFRLQIIPSSPIDNSLRPYLGDMAIKDLLLGTTTPISSTDTSYYTYTTSSAMSPRFQILQSNPHNTKIVIPFMDSMATAPTRMIVMDGNIMKFSKVPATGALINDATSTSSTTYSSTKINSLISGAGGGDMLKSVYDPTGINADAFNYNNLYNKPTIPTNNNTLTNGANYITASGVPVTSVAGRTGAVVLAKADVSGIENVDNTSDISKPISTATQTALNLKADDANVVHLTGTEAIGGSKSFTNSIGIGGAASTPYSLAITNNSNGKAGILISNSTAGTGAYSGIFLETTSGTADGQLFKYGSTTTAYKTVHANDLGFYNYNSGNISILNDVAAGTVNIAAGGSSTPQLIVNADGSVTIANLTGTGTRMMVADASGNISSQTIPAGSLDKFNEVSTGSTSSTLTLANSYITGTIRLYKNGIRITDFTEAGGANITLTDARLSSDTFIIDYKY